MFCKCFETASYWLRTLHVSRWIWDVESWKCVYFYFWELRTSVSRIPSYVFYGAYSWLADVIKCAIQRNRASFNGKIKKPKLNWDACKCSPCRDHCSLWPLSPFPLSADMWIIYILTGSEAHEKNVPFGYFTRLRRLSIDLKWYYGFFCI